METMQMEKKLYEWPKLSYGYKDFVLALGYKGDFIRNYFLNYNCYNNDANVILENLNKVRQQNSDIDLKSTLKSLSFNIGGHVLHSLFWPNLDPVGKGGGKPGGVIGDVLEKEFGSFDRFKKEFTQVAMSVEGSGWAALTYCRQTNRPLIMQIEKHNTNIYPMFRILMVLDVWEHAYYLDHQNERDKFVDTFWNIVNWDSVNKRLEDLL